jgi:glycerol-3-phosphate dehydrogenase
MAADAVNEAVRSLDARVPDSCTDRVPLVGAEGFLGVWNQRRRLAAVSGLHVARIEHLLHRYGSTIDELLALVRADPTLADPLPGADDYLRVEALYAVTHEGARHLEDVLARRTRISIESWDRGVECAETVARLMAFPLGWDEAALQREVTHYRTRVAAERESQNQRDDATADAARLGAPDIVRTG